jgi:hypothetical protein
MSGGGGGDGNIINTDVAAWQIEWRRAAKREGNRSKYRYQKFKTLSRRGTRQYA